MPTKKTPEQPAVPKPSKAERGRYARLLADGYVIELEPAKPPPTEPVGPAARRSPPTT
jgi:hypothetical protein